MTTPSDDDRVSARALEPFEISLTSTPTAGYSWVLSACPPEIELIEETSRGVMSDTLGGSLAQVFHFRARAPGRFALVFDLKRPWLEDTADTRTIEVLVEG